MARTVAIKNLSSRPFLATLYHHLYCRYRNKCDCKNERYTSSSSVGVTRAKRKNPASLWLAKGDEKKGLHPAILRLPQVVDAKKFGYNLEITYSDSASKAARSPAPPVNTASETKRLLRAKGVRSGRK